MRQRTADLAVHLAVSIVAIVAAIMCGAALGTGAYAMWHVVVP